MKQPDGIRNCLWTNELQRPLATPLKAHDNRNLQQFGSIVVFYKQIKLVFLKQKVGLVYFEIVSLKEYSKVSKFLKNNNVWK